MGRYKLPVLKNDSDFCKLYKTIVGFAAKLETGELYVSQYEHAILAVNALLEYVSGCRGVVTQTNLNRAVESASLPNLATCHKSGYLFSSKTLEGMQKSFENVRPSQLLPDKDDRKKPKLPINVHDRQHYQKPGKRSKRGRGDCKGKDSSRRKAADMILSK